MEVENTGNLLLENKYELNPNHTHFILLKDQSLDGSGLKSFILELEHFLSNTGNEYGKGQECMFYAFLREKLNVRVVFTTFRISECFTDGI